MPPLSVPSGAPVIQLYIHSCVVFYSQTCDHQGRLHFRDQILLTLPGSPPLLPREEEAVALTGPWNARELSGLSPAISQLGRIQQKLRKETPEAKRKPQFSRSCGEEGLGLISKLDP